MPTIGVDKAQLFEELGREYTTDEFDQLCFDYGLELDEDTTDQVRPIVDGVQEPPQLKIEVPANRYDLLCIEGIARSLNVFLKRQSAPQFKLTKPSPATTITVEKDTTKIRPLVAGAVLRGVKFDKLRYESFISLQDKLHQNLARQRTLVAIGTHDLSKIKGPFTYEALPPEQIEFAPLNQNKSMNAKQMMEFYEKDRHLGRYLHIIRDSPVYPVIYDSNRTVLSMPPIINGDLSKISLETTDVFIECTATDKSKLDVVINMMVTMFSMYCKEPLTIEPVSIESPHNQQSRQTPNLHANTFTANVNYLNSATGLSLSSEEMCKRLQLMCLSATPKSSEVLEVVVPPTRPDILHEADIMEDLAVSYGFNNLPTTRPFLRSITFAAPLPISKLSDIIRHQAAHAGWSEVLSLILCSHDENFAFLNKKDDGKTAVKLQNPKTAEYQNPRTSLLPGILKSLNANRRHGVPMKIFEVSDVTFKDESQERKARNERHFVAAYCGKTSGFEQVHGLLDAVMEELNFAFLERSLVDADPKDKKNYIDGYWIEKADNPTFFEGYSAVIKTRRDGRVQAIGTSGVLHPSVIKNFGIEFPVSALEINIESFL